ncbi:TPA: phage tail protein [Escherichia coli]
MFYVDNPTGVPVMPPVAAELSKTTLYFTEGGNGIPPTYPGPDWFNIIQSELLEILRQANIKPDKNTTDQIMTALKKLFITNSGSAGAIAGLTGQNNTFPYFTGKDTMALTPLSAFVRGILGKNSASDFVKDIGAGRAFSGSVSIGGDSGAWTTAQFISWLESQGAFNHPYWMCKGSWAYANNKVITDTGCGNIQLAGAVVEVMGVKSAMTIRVTTPTTATNGTTSSQFTYINHGDAYSPGWRREYNTRNKPTASDVGALPANGNAVSATRLQTARRINNVLFDGTRDITINTTDPGAVRNFQYTNEVFYNPGSTTITWRFRAPSGCQLSGIYVQDTGKNTADNIGGVYYKQAQIYINGAWRSVSG